MAASTSSSLHLMPEILPESISASGRAAEKLSLPALQSKMKCDPECYETELILLYNQFKSSLELFQQQAALNFTSISGVAADTTVAKDLSDRAVFLAHMTPFYPNHLAEFPKQLAGFLGSAARILPSGLRCHITQALILLMNKQIVEIGDTLALFMDLQTLGDRTLRKLAFSHVVHNIGKMNKKHKNEAKNRALQNILFVLLQQEDEAKAKRSLITLCDLHRRKVWFDERTANAICTACFHTSSRIMIAALSFLINYEIIEDEDDSDASSSEDDEPNQQPHIVVSKEAIYKAHNKGTTSSKKKKKAKLQRVIRSMKRQQRISSEKNNNSSYYSPLNHLKDAQAFAEKLFSRLKGCNERFEVKMMMLKVITRTVGLHRLILLDLYAYLQKYVRSHQRDVTNLLTAVVQACHDMVPPDAVEPLFKQLVQEFVHDRSRPEAITVGLNVVREICLRIPLLMTEDLLQDLVLYKKSHEKSVSSAARSLITVFREICPSLLIKKDRGRPTNPKARPKAFGEVNVATNVPGFELLQEDDDSGHEGSDVNDEDGLSNSSGGIEVDDEDGAVQEDDDSNMGNNDSDDASEHESGSSADDNDDSGNGVDASDEDDVSGDEDDDDHTEDESDASDKSSSDVEEDGESDEREESKVRKRKFSDFDEQLNAVNRSLRALKKLAGAKMGQALDTSDGILSNEDFQKIKELKAKKEARNVLTQHGFKLPSSDQLSAKRVDPAKLEVHIRKKLSKQQRLELIRAGREERGNYQSRAATKKKKTGGSSNKQKEHKKAMPLAAKRSKVARSRLEKKKKQQRSGKQFRGRKAWK